MAAFDRPTTPDAAAEETLERQLAAAVGDTEGPPEQAGIILRMLLIGSRYHLDDAALVAAVSDRLSWRRFCGIPIDGEVPDLEALTRFRRLVSAIGEADTAPAERRAAEHAPFCDLSIVSPVYLAETLVDELVQRVVEEASKVTEDFEVVLVDDGSPDRSWQRIVAAGMSDPRVKGIRLSRNFGQHQAITAGLDHATGNWVLVMDCDLQDDPSYIGDLYTKAREGYDIVYTEKQRRAHGWVKNLFASLYTTTINWLSGGRPASANVGAYSILSRKAVAAFQQVREAQRHYLLVLRWLGFAATSIEVIHRPRPRSRSSYSPLRLVRHAVVGITAQSNRLLYVALAAGGVFLCFSLLTVGILVAKYYLSGLREGWTSTIVLTLLSTSIILVAIGTMGIYVGKIFDQVKQRPLYLLQDKINL